jgi:hypothetical protein
MIARAANLDRELDHFEQRLPPAMVRGLRWLRKPSSRWTRIPAGTALIVGGSLSFLPILGIWMVPLGLILIAQDVPPLRSPTARLLAWINARWPARGKRPHAKTNPRSISPEQQ